MTPRALEKSQAAEYLGISPSLFELKVRDGTIPQPRLWNSKPVWDRIELDETFTSLPRRGEEENEWDVS